MEDLDFDKGMISRVRPIAPSFMLKQRTSKMHSRKLKADAAEAPDSDVSSMEKDTIGIVIVLIEDSSQFVRF